MRAVEGVASGYFLPFGKHIFNREPGIGKAAEKCANGLLPLAHSQRLRTETMDLPVGGKVLGGAIRNVLIQILKVAPNNSFVFFC